MYIESLTDNEGNKFSDDYVSWYIISARMLVRFSKNSIVHDPAFGRLSPLKPSPGNFTSEIHNLYFSSIHRPTARTVHSLDVAS